MAFYLKEKERIRSPSIHSGMQPFNTYRVAIHLWRGQRGSPIDSREVRTRYLLGPRGSLSAICSPVCFDRVVFEGRDGSRFIPTTCSLVHGVSLLARNTTIIPSHPPRIKACGHRRPQHYSSATVQSLNDAEWFRRLPERKRALHVRPQTFHISQFE